MTWVLETINASAFRSPGYEGCSPGSRSRSLKSDPTQSFIGDCWTFCLLYVVHTVFLR